MNTMTCNECGRPLEPQDKFCSGCGQRVAANALKRSKPSHVTLHGHWKRDGLIIGGVVVAVLIIFMSLRQSPEPVPTQASSSPSPPGHEETSDMLANLPNDYASLVEMGNQTMDQQNFPLAAELYRRALDMDGSSPNVRTDFGSCLHAMGLPLRAIEEFQTVVRDHPDHAISRFNLGIVYHGLGEADSARHYWERYLEMDPEGGPADAARRFLSELGT